MAERLLGALILNVYDPRPFPNDGAQRSKITDSWVHVYTEENSSIYAEWIKSKSIKTQANLPIPVALTAAGVPMEAVVSGGLPYESSSTSRFDTGPARITTQTLNAPISYVHWLVGEYQDYSAKKNLFLSNLLRGYWTHNCFFREIFQ